MSRSPSTSHRLPRRRTKSPDWTASLATQHSHPKRNDVHVASSDAESGSLAIGRLRYDADRTLGAVDELRLVSALALPGKPPAGVPFTSGDRFWPGGEVERPLRARQQPLAGQVRKVGAAADGSVRPEGDPGFLGLVREHEGQARLQPRPSRAWTVVPALAASQPIGSMPRDLLIAQDACHAGIDPQCRQIGGGRLAEMTGPTDGVPGLGAGAERSAMARNTSSPSGVPPRALSATTSSTADLPRSAASARRRSRGAPSFARDLSDGAAMSKRGITFPLGKGNSRGWSFLKSRSRTKTSNRRLGPLVLPLLDQASGRDNQAASKSPRMSRSLIRKPPTTAFGSGLSAGRNRRGRRGSASICEEVIAECGPNSMMRRAVCNPMPVCILWCRRGLELRPTPGCPTGPPHRNPFGARIGVRMDSCTLTRCYRQNGLLRRGPWPLQRVAGGCVAGARETKQALN